MGIYFFASNPCPKKALNQIVVWLNKNVLVYTLFIPTFSPSLVQFWFSLKY